MDEKLFQSFDSFDFETNEKFQDGWKTIKTRLGDTVSESTFFNAKLYFFAKHVKPINLEKYVLWKQTADNSKSNTESPSPLKESPHKSESEQKQVDQCTEAVVNHESDISASPLPHAPTLSHGISSFTASKSVQQKEANGSERMPDLKSNYLGQDSFSSPGPKPETNSFRAGSNSSESHVQETNSTLTEPDIQQSDEDKPPFLSQSAVQQPDKDKRPSLSLAELAELVRNQQPIPGVITLDVQPTNTDPTPSVMTRRPKPWQSGGAMV